MNVHEVVWIGPAGLLRGQRLRIVGGRVLEDLGRREPLQTIGQFKPLKRLGLQAPGEVGSKRDLDLVFLRQREERVQTGRGLFLLGLLIVSPARGRGCQIDAGLRTQIRPIFSRSS